MPKILLLASVVLLFFSGILSFLNKGKLTNSLIDTKAAQQKVSGAVADAAKARTDLVKAKKDAQDATQHAADVQTQYDGLKTQVTDLTAKVQTDTDNVAAKQKQIDDLTAQVAVRANATPAPTDVPNPEMVDLKRQKDELQLVKDSMETQLKTAQSQLASAQQRLQGIGDQHAMLGLHGRVLAVNREYNFVVLDLGSRNGVSGNATMLVERGGSLVGRIRTVSVEPSQTVADIVPNSVPAGIIVQPGDTVIFPGS